MEDFDTWVSAVRDPAEQAKEGKRTLEADEARASYQIAPLPDGTWAVRVQTCLEMVSGMTIPWRVFPTRKEAVDHFLHEARAFFEREQRISNRKVACLKKILALLSDDGSLFRWVEPEPD